MKTDSKKSVLQFTETEIDSLYCKAQQRLKEKVLFNNSHGTITATEITQTGYSTKTSSDHSINLCILWNIYHKLCCFFGDFFPSGMQDAEVTKSQHYHYHSHYHYHYHYRYRYHHHYHHQYHFRYHYTQSAH